jgi:hypothetical protein
MSDLIAHYRQLVGIAKTWAMKNLPGWSDDSHRDLLSRYGAMQIDGRVSASTLSLSQLGAVLDDYERRGWTRIQQFNRGGAQRHVPSVIAHIVRLWGKLGQAGKVAKATRPALLAFCARQTGREVPNLDSLTTAECQAIIEALKGWLGR